MFNISLSIIQIVTVRQKRIQTRNFQNLPLILYYKIFYDCTAVFFNINCKTVIKTLCREMARTTIQCRDAAKNLH